MKIKNQKPIELFRRDRFNLTFSFLLEKLGLTGEVLEEFTVIGHIQEYNLGGFGYIEDLMGLDYSLPNEIELEISIADVTIVNKQNND